MDITGSNGSSSRRSGFTAALTRYFKIEERGSTVRQEIKAGIVTFTISCYILLVIPQVLSTIGYVPVQVVITTALSSGIASIVAGLLGNLPLCLSPHIGLSAYLASGLVNAGLLTKEEAMTTCLFAGLALIVTALLGINDTIMKAVPHCIKLAAVCGMGLLLALIGMASTDIVVPNEDTLVTLGDVGEYKIWLALGGIVFTGSLLFHQVKIAIPAGIALMSLVVYIVEVLVHHKKILQPPLIWQLNNVSLPGLNYPSITATLAFYFVSLFEVQGVLNGMASLVNLFDADGKVPGSKWAYLGTAVGTVVGALTGTTPIVIAPESAPGILEGGRTGLTGVTVGVLFLLSTLLTPVLAIVPRLATAPVLIIVGTLMMEECPRIEWADMSQAIPAFLTTMMIPFTYSIPNGILFGLGMSAFFYFSTGAFLVHLRARKRGGAPTETTGLYDGKALTRQASFLDDQALVRRPSLILPKANVTSPAPARNGPSATANLHV